MSSPLFLRRRIILCLGSILFLTGGCAPVSQQVKPEVWDCFYNGEYKRVMADEERRAGESRSDCALAWANYASAALACGEYESASRALERATGIMLDFRPEGEWRALHGSEETKIYKGWPYEKAAAFLYLGMLDMMDGAYDKSLASFKTAVLADAGTRDERYRCDSPWAYVMLARAHLALGEESEAEDSTRDAVRVVRCRLNNGVVQDVVLKSLRQLQTSRANEDKEILAALSDMILQQLYWGNSDAETPLVALHEVAKSCGPILGSGLVRRDASGKQTKLDVAMTKAYFQKLVVACESTLARVPDKLYVDRTREMAAGITRLADKKNNVIVILDLGRGPYKFRTGLKEHLIKVARDVSPEYSALVDVGGWKTEKATRVEDMFFQAATLGGREMDAILGGKAVFKDRVETFGSLAYQIGGNYALPILIIALATSGSTDSQADIRAWRCLPGEVHMEALQLPQGEYDVTVRFLDVRGDELPSLRLQRSGLRVHAPPEPSVWYFRSRGKVGGSSP